MIEKEMKTLTAGEVKYIVTDEQARTDIASIKERLGTVEEDVTSKSPVSTNTIIGAGSVNINDGCDIEATNIIVGVHANDGHATPSTVKGFNSASFNFTINCNGVNSTLSVPSVAVPFYGGSFDLINGTLVKNMGAVQIKSLTWTYNGTDKVFYATISGKSDAYSELTQIRCEAYTYAPKYDDDYETENHIIVEKDGYVYIRDTSYTTAQSFVGAMGDYYIAYRVSTPVVYDLPQIKISPVVTRGTFSITATNLGGNRQASIEITYPVDTKIYAEKAIANVQNNLNDLEADVTNIASDLEESKTTIDEKASVILNHAGPAPEVTFLDGASNGKVASLLVKIVPKQSGSGDASPENIRPITGYDTVELDNNGTPVEINISENAGTVYAAELDVLTGTLTVYGVATTIGALTWTYYDDTQVFRTSISGKTNSNELILCSAYKTVDANLAAADMPDQTVKEHYGTASTFRVYYYIKDTRFTTPEALVAAMGSQTLIYRRRTPLTYQITPAQINTILGENNFSVNCGTLEMEYTSDTKLYVTTQDIITFDDSPTEGSNKPVKSNGIFTDIRKHFVVSAASYSWSIGNISSSTGMTTESTTRLRIVGDTPNGKITNYDSIVTEVPAGMKLYAFKYSGDTITNSFIGTEGKWFGSGTHYFNDAPYYRFVVAFDDDRDIVQSNAADVLIKQIAPTDRGLTEENKAADAKETGDRISQVYTDLEAEIEDSVAEAQNDAKGVVTEYQLSDYTRRNKSINDDGNWYGDSSLKHIIIPIEGQNIIKIKNSSENSNSVIAFLLDATVPGSNDEDKSAAFATGESGRRKVLAGNTDYITVPEDAKYLFVYCGTSSNNYANTPSEITSYAFTLSSSCWRAILEVYNTENSKSASELTRDIPKNQGVRNMYKKVHQLLDVEYSIPAEIPSRSHGEDSNKMPAGDYQGVIYSGTADKAHYVGWNVSLKSYITALHNQYSGMYTEDTNEERQNIDGYSASAYGIQYQGTNSSTPLGTVCAPFVAYVLGMDVKWENHAWPYLEKIGIMEKIADQSHTGVELGDTISMDGHVAIISDIYRDKRGEPKQIYVSESDVPRGRTKVYSASGFDQYLVNNKKKTIYRYRYLDKNLEYQPSELVAVEDEVIGTEYVFNEDICPYLGDYSVYREGELIAACYTKGNYNRMIITKDGTDIQTITLDSSDDVHTVDFRTYNLTAGNYTIRLSDGSGNESQPAYFKVVYLPITVAENGDSITVDFDKTKDPRYIQVNTPAGAARCVITLSDEDKNSGSKTFNIRDAITQQNSSINLGIPCTVSVIYGVVDPAGYKLIRASEFAPLTWIN